MSRYLKMMCVLAVLQLAAVRTVAADDECPPYISCTLEDGPCQGELVGELVLDGTDIEFEILGGLIRYWIDLGFCVATCAYEVVDGDGEIYDVEISGVDCGDEA